MSAHPPDPVILGYIRANRGQFGREAIDGELRASGHPPEAIAAAWAAIEAENAPGAQPDAPLPPPEPPSSAADPASPEAPDAPFSPMPPAAPQPDTDPLVPVISTQPGAMRDPGIDRYISENRGTYTRPAITDSLLASGHARADIDAAWAAIAAAEAPPPLPPEAQADRRAVLRSWRFWLTAVLTFISLITLPIVSVWLAPDQPFGPVIACALLVGYVAVGLILLAVKRARDVAYGFLAGVGALFALFTVLTLIGFILLIVVFGICLVVLGQQAATP